MYRRSNHIPEGFDTFPVRLDMSRAGVPLSPETGGSSFRSSGLQPNHFRSAKLQPGQRPDQPKQLNCSPSPNPNPNPNQNPNPNPNPSPNRAQTGPKPSPNRAQTEPKPSPNRAQTEPKPSSNRARTRTRTSATAEGKLISLERAAAKPLQIS